MKWIFFKYLFRNIEEEKRNSRGCQNIVFNQISEKLKTHYKKLASTPKPFQSKKNETIIFRELLKVGQKQQPSVNK